MIIWFVNRFVLGANYIEVNEGETVWPITDYLNTAPKEIVFNLIGANHTKGNTEVTYICIVREILRRYASANVLRDATEEVKGFRQGNNQKATRFHYKFVTKANRLGRSFDAGDLLNIFISSIDDSITSAVQQGYND